MPDVAVVFGLLIAGSVIFWLADALFCIGLIDLLRHRHALLWRQIGCPRATLIGYLAHRFSPRRFALTYQDRSFDDVPLVKYCAAYRVFNWSLCAYLLCGPLVLIAAMLHSD